jgi:hypothetical protein
MWSGEEGGRETAREHVRRVIQGREEMRNGRVETLVLKGDTRSRLEPGGYWETSGMRLFREIEILMTTGVMSRIQATRVTSRRRGKGSEANRREIWRWRGMSERSSSWYHTK